MKNNHNVVSYHHVREYVASGFIVLSYVRLENNYADLLAKALSRDNHYGLCKPLMFTPII